MQVIFFMYQRVKMKEIKPHVNYNFSTTLQNACLTAHCSKIALTVFKPRSLHAWMLLKRGKDDVCISMTYWIKHRFFCPNIVEFVQLQIGNKKCSCNQVGCQNIGALSKELIPPLSLRPLVKSLKIQKNTGMFFFQILI